MAVYGYSLKLDGETKLSEHFKVLEFGSIGQGKIYSDQTLIDTALVEKLELLHKFFGASAIIINSGYRTKTHDIAVGGGGTGQHTLGMAADICVYVDGKIVSAKKVCCVAQDLGFRGIGYICENATHVDTRDTATTWYGDETVTCNASISPKDFYKYFGITKGTIIGNIPTEDDIKSTIETSINPYSKPTVNIKKGDKSDGVKWVQTQLISKGYSCGSSGVDGNFGSATDTAIRVFQKDNGLLVDGIAGVNTVAFLAK